MYVLLPELKASGITGKHVAGISELPSIRSVTSGQILLDTTYFVMSLPRSMFSSPISRRVLDDVARRQLSTMPQTYVKRVTLFKVPKPEDVDQASRL